MLNDSITILKLFIEEYSLDSMKIKMLEQKYSKRLMNKIFKEGHLEGCTIAVVNGEDDIPESDIIRAIRTMKGEKIYNWD